LKWGSTNAYTEDAAGHPVYDWSILDRIFDTYQQTGVKPLVEIGFMPEALSTHPQPYRHTFPVGSLWTGWAYPPKDYHAWGAGLSMGASLRGTIWRAGSTELVLGSVERARHRLLARNSQEYYKLYDFAADAVKRPYPRRASVDRIATGRHLRRRPISSAVFWNTHCTEESSDRKGRDRHLITSGFTPRQSAPGGWPRRDRQSQPGPKYFKRF